MEPSIQGLKRARPYIRRYKNETFVIKIGGGLLDEAPVRESLADQIALLGDFGIRVALVHGGGKQVTEWSRKMGIEPEIVAGRRVTSPEVLDLAVMIFAGSVNTGFTEVLARRGVPAVGLTGADALCIRAKRRGPVEIEDDGGVRRTVDFGRVGDIRRVDPALFLSLMDNGFVPVLACLGTDEDGGLLNINADGVAEALAVSLSARKLIFLTESDGLLRDPADPGTLVPFADHDDLETLLASGGIQAGMRPKVEACMRATKNGVKRTHILNGRAPDSLLEELFTGKGCGTMIVGRREKKAYEDEELF